MNLKYHLPFHLPGGTTPQAGPGSARSGANHLKHLAFALTLGAGLGGGSASAQAIIEVGGAGTIADEALLTNKVPAAGVNWTVNGNAGGIKYSGLVSPAVAVGTTGNVTLTFDHRYNFEETGDPWDGGAVFVSVNDGPFTYVPLASFSSNGYIGTTTANVGSAWATGGEAVFYGQSAGYGTPALITSVADLGPLTAGDTVEVEFRGGWDAAVVNGPPAWEVSTVKLTDAGAADILDADFTADGSSGFTVANSGTVTGPWTYLQPVSRFEINATTADRYTPVTVGSVIDFNGAKIEVVKLSGTLVAGQIYTLFDLSGGTTLAGTPGSISLPAGTWDTSSLAVDGTITLVAAPPVGIYEPFDYPAGNLAGKSGTSEYGLSGAWGTNPNTTTKVIAGSLIGAVARKGGSIDTSPNVNHYGGARSVSASALAENGLLGNGATLWFSVDLGYGTGGNLTNSRLGFALANSQFSTTNFLYNINNEGPQNGSGLGVTLGRFSSVNGKVVATRFNNTGTGFGGNTFGNEPASAFFTAGGQHGLIVGKITWGDPALAVPTLDTIELYKPANDLVLPGAPFSTLTTDVDQSTYDTITFCWGDKVVLDEIRFGASYAAVTPPDVSGPALTATDPLDGEADGLTVQQTAFFDEPVVLGTGDIRIVNDTDAVTTTIAVADAQVVVSGNTLKITPTIPLIGGKNYHIEMDAGVLEDASGNLFAGIADSTTWNFTADNILPALVSIGDNVNGFYPFLGYPVGGPIYAIADKVTYTVTFNEPMQAATVNPADFENALSPAAVINSVTATANPAVFTVLVSPGGAGSLQLRLAAGATLNDASGNALDAGSATPDDTTIAVVAGANPVIALDGFEGMDALNISTTANAPRTNWEDVTSRYKPTYLGGTPAATPGNVLPDQTGSDGAAGTTLKGVRVRSTTGAMCLKRPMPLSTINAGTVTIEFDLKEVTLNYNLQVQYSANGTFTDAVAVASYTGAGTLGSWVHKSYTLTDGVGGIVFTDTAQFMIRRFPLTGVGANGTYHTFDNINITWAAAGGSPYDTWASTNAPSPQTADQDFDGDGVSNAVEFVLGGDKDTNDLGKLPTLATNGTDATFTFVRDQDSIDATTVVTIEVSTDLVDWSTTYPVPNADTAGVVNPGVTVASGASTDTVTLTVPQNPGKKFARLKVAITP